MYRRAPHLVAYWDDGGFHVQNYARGASVVMSSAEARILDHLDEWRDRDTLARTFGDFGRRRLNAFLRSMTRKGVIESSEQPVDPAQRALSVWDDWSPSAAFFHFDTRNMRYVDQVTIAETLSAREVLEPPPARLKYSRGDRIGLPPVPRRGAVPSLLRSRRSWRRFGTGAMTLQQLSTLLGLTWGVQGWIRVGRRIHLPLKTSPSGGAAHSLEAYVAVRRVRGLAPGVYHYAPDAHELVRLNRKWSARWITRGLAGQAWIAKANVVVFMTSVFSRVQWKYRTPRAYRTILIEAGHFCQTFCLVATWLGLAPFCTASLGESTIEPVLRIDGISESLLYVTGAGTRPRGVRWAPYPDTSATPDISQPTHQRRRR